MGDSRNDDQLNINEFLRHVKAGDILIVGTKL
jgi:hypothetical protein